MSSRLNLPPGELPLNLVEQIAPAPRPGLLFVPEKISVKLRPSLRYHLGAKFHWNKICYGAAENDQPGLFHRHHEPSPACA